MASNMRNLSGLHLLLTYGCTSACDHCFVYGSPRCGVVFTLEQVEELIRQAVEVPSVHTFYFEGGEPFLHYPVLVEAFHMARKAGFKCGIVTNSYWATSVANAELYLRPFQKMGLIDLSISDDELHVAEGEPRLALNAYRAAENLGLPLGKICLESPKIVKAGDRHGKPVVGGGVLFKGRAADNLTDGLPTQPAASFNKCKEEDFVDVHRVHIDPYGWVHICQGIVAGNVFEQPLAEIVAGYDPDNEPIIGPLVEGGPAMLARKYDVSEQGEFVDSCHMCFLTRRALIDRFPEHLAPRHVYGLTTSSRQ